MSTAFLHPTEDPNEDITNAPQYYHNFNGKGVRIRVYWTAAIWQNFELGLRHADRVLRKYILSLDVIPIGGSAAIHAAIRTKVAGQFATAVGRQETGVEHH